MVSWRQRARALKAQALTVWFVARDPALPWWLRLLAMAMAAYAFSPIDLVPDFIPVLGLLDDLVLLPLGIALLLRLTPPEVLARARMQAETAAERPVSRAAALVVIASWLVLAFAALCGWRSRG